MGARSVDFLAPRTSYLQGPCSVKREGQFLRELTDIENNLRVINLIQRMQNGK